MSNKFSARAGFYSHTYIVGYWFNHHTLLCVGPWSLLGYVRDEDVKAAAVLPEVNGEEEELEADWDAL